MLMGNINYERKTSYHKPTKQDFARTFTKKCIVDMAKDVNSCIHCIECKVDRDVLTYHCSRGINKQLL